MVKVTNHNKKTIWFKPMKFKWMHAFVWHILSTPARFPVMVFVGCKNKNTTIFLVKVRKR